MSYSHTKKRKLIARIKRGHKPKEYPNAIAKRISRHNMGCIHYRPLVSTLRVTENNDIPI